jgi:hypothetical protein
MGIAVNGVGSPKGIAVAISNDNGATWTEHDSGKPLPALRTLYGGPTSAHRTSSDQAPGCMHPTSSSTVITWPAHSELVT